MLALLLCFLILIGLLFWLDIQYQARALYWQRVAEIEHLRQTVVTQFWAWLYGHLNGRVRRIWRHCRRHYGFGIDILQNVQWMLHHLT